VIPAAFHQAYAERQSDWRLSKEEAKTKMKEAGGDGFWLLDRLDESAPEEVLGLDEVEALRQVWEQQFERKEESGKVTVRKPPTRGKGVVDTPHDKDARWAEKRGKNWVGYRLQVSETAEEDAVKQFITDTDAVDANDNDSESVDEIQERLIERKLKPNEHYIDRGYVSDANLAHSGDRGIELTGLAPLDNSRKPEEYKQSAFKIDFERQEAICPEGKASKA
jgi:hypothetical protein